MTVTSPLGDSARNDDGDRALVGRASADEREALEELVRRHQAWIYNIAIRMLAHPADAEDATQGILIKALTRRRRSRAAAASGPGCTASPSTTR